MLSTRVFYRAATLVPFVGLVIAAALARPISQLEPGWEWVYPTSPTRGVMVYAILAAWLWIEIGRRPLADLRRMMWWTPLLFIGLSWLLMLALSLVRGAVGELWSEYGGAIAQRTVVHLLVGYGYVGLAHVLLARLRRGGEAGDES